VGNAEMSPLGSINQLLAKHSKLPASRAEQANAKPRPSVYGVDLEILDDEGNPVAHVAWTTPGGSGQPIGY